MKKYKRAFLLVFVLLNIYGLLCGVLYFFQENLIFHPTVLPQDYTFEFDIPFEEVIIDTPDGAQLNGLHFTVTQPKGAIIYYHGNAGDVQRWGEITQYFVQKGYAVIVMDYRGYGKTTGERSETALYEDAAQWYAYAKSAYPESQLTVYGRSLGTTFAAYVAGKHQPKNLILETPFYSLVDEAKSRFPILPIKRLLHYKFPTYSYINEVQCPITIFHGTEDGVVNYEHGKRLFDHITSPHKTFVTIPEGRHNDLVNFKEYTGAIEKAFKKR